MKKIVLCLLAFGFLHADSINMDDLYPTDQNTTQSAEHKNTNGKKIDSDKETKLNALTIYLLEKLNMFVSEDFYSKVDKKINAIESYKPVQKTSTQDAVKEGLSLDTPLYQKSGESQLELYENKVEKFNMQANTIQVGAGINFSYNVRIRHKTILKLFFGTALEMTQYSKEQYRNSFVRHESFENTRNYGDLIYYRSTMEMIGLSLKLFDNHRIDITIRQSTMSKQNIMNTGFAIAENMLRIFNLQSPELQAFNATQIFASYTWIF